MELNKLFFDTIHSEYKVTPQQFLNWCDGWSERCNGGKLQYPCFSNSNGKFIPNPLSEHAEPSINDNKAVWNIKGNDDDGSRWCGWTYLHMIWDGKYQQLRDAYCEMYGLE